MLDFTWVRAGPWCTRWLGALGAEVIKVEWPRSPNTRGNNIATGAGTPEGLPANLNTNGHFSDTNSNKLSVTLNTRTPRGIDLTRRLVAMSDIVIENFAYGVLERWGLGYEDMKKLRPDIVYLSMSGFGHTGRDRDYQTMGAIAQALSGLTYTSGLPDKPPAGWGWSYLDDTGGLFGAMYALSAIYHRNMTGQGQHVDSSQWIIGVPLNGAAFLDIQANERSTVRTGYPPGNRAHWPGTPLVNNYRGLTVAPHNAYKTSPGEYNDWCAIVCRSDDEWRRLVGAMGSPSWANGEKFATLEGRLEHQEEMDQGIEAWTKTLGKYEIMERCQAAGVAAMPVQNSQDRVDNDPQLRHREMYRDVEHPALGTWPLQNAPFKMSETPAFNSRPGPLIGGHNKEVFEGLLGISHEELVNGFEDGTFWPKDLSMDEYPYFKKMMEDPTLVRWEGNEPMANPGPAPARTPGAGAFGGLRVLELAERVSPLGLGADVITGFPGESEHDHDSTRALIDELPFTYLHVFPFSPRDGTVAVRLPHPVPQRVSGQRSRELREIAQAKGREYRETRVGGSAEVVVEGDGGTALTGDYLRVGVGGALRTAHHHEQTGTLERLPTGTLQGDADHLYITLSQQPSVISA